MILGYKQTIGNQEPYHYGKIAGIDRKFIRVVAGAALPIFDRMLGAVVIIAETYRASGPPTWVVLSAITGEWAMIENAMTQYRMDLKFTHVIVEKEEARKVIWGMKGLLYGLHEIPLVSYAAPSYAATEIGRSYLTQLWRAEKRLTIPDHVQAQIEMETQAGTLALQCAMCWQKENPAYYCPSLKQKERHMGRILGTLGLE